jgi:hypothetical protein
LKGGMVAELPEIFNREDMPLAAPAEARTRLPPARIRTLPIGQTLVIDDDSSRALLQPIGAEAE